MNSKASTDHLMKSLDELIAEQKPGTGKKPQKFIPKA